MGNHNVSEEQLIDDSLTDSDTFDFDEFDEPISIASPIEERVVRFIFLIEAVTH